jgi:hypothetical protein
MDVLLADLALAAAQQLRGTMGVLSRVAASTAPRQSPPTLPHRDRLLWTEPRPWGAAKPRSILTSPPKPREVFIQGVTLDGKTFRPSDWAERLAGAMSSFRPDRPVGGGIGAFIGYSPYCVPQMVGGVKCVIVNEALRDLEPMAWDFVMNFARDNNLMVGDACVVPAPGERRR